MLLMIDKLNMSNSWRFAIGAVSWLVLISLLHFWLNFDHGNKKIVSMGYMPVVTNLAAPLMDHASKESDTYFKALKFSSFAEMAEALRHNEIQAAFMIAPLAVVLHQQSDGIRVVYIGNRHESTFVVKKELAAESLSDLRGKTIAVPMRYSGHNLSILKSLEEQGLSGQVKVVELNPPDMASALISGALDGYFVGEPFAAQTIRSGKSDLLFHVEEEWDGFICNLVIVRQSLIDREPETVRTLVRAAIRSGLWAEDHIDQAAEIAARYWSQPVDLVKYALKEPPNRMVYDRFVPREDEMQEIADLMVRYDLLKDANIEGLVDDRFARAVELGPVAELKDIF